MLEAMGAEWVPCVVVGNKSDIENARCDRTDVFASARAARADRLMSVLPATVARSRMVSAAEGKKFAASIKAPFVETSATKNANLSACCAPTEVGPTPVGCHADASSVRETPTDELMNLLLHEIWYTKEGNVAPAATATAASGGSWISSWFGGGKK